ncbi:hypothetical protein, partial [Bradyrhizobium sp.]
MKSETMKSETAKSEAAKPDIAKAEPVKPVEKMAEKPVETTANGAATLEALRDSDGLRLTFGFGQVTPAALFRRGDTVWMVFD